MHDDKGLGSLYEQIVKLQEQERRDHETWKSDAWKNYNWQLDSQPPGYNVSKKSG